MKNVFNVARGEAQEDINNSLADFRQKRELGLSNLFGGDELKDDMDRQTEFRIIEKCLKPHYDKL